MFDIADPRPRVAIDARHLHSGIGRYIENLVRGLAAIGAGRELDVCLLGDPGRLADLARAGGFAVRRARSRLYAPWSQLELAHLAGDAALFHATHYPFPWAYPGRLVVTVHDLHHLAPPRGPRDLARWCHARLMLAGIARRAGTVITGSEAAAREIRARWPGLGDRLRVIHHGIDPSFRPVTDGVRLAACRRALGLPERFVLVLGNLRPYKNVATVIAAMARLEAASDVHLVVAGEGARPGAPLLAAACRAAPGVRLQAIGPVAPEWLTALISLATVGACPSRREGFGLVPLEMLACGTAVVVSDIAPHREVLGEDVPRVAPDDVDGWAAQLAHLLASAVARRAQVEALAGRVASGSLAGQAAAHLEVYQAALAGRHRRPRPFA